MQVCFKLTINWSLKSSNYECQENWPHPIHGCKKYIVNEEIDLKVETKLELGKQI
jgi:hypothetical protein